MQHTPSEIKEKLLKAVDKEYNVLDMGAVVEVISILERTPITKEALESTRLGKYVNELRRKTTNESLAKRAKDLVRQWRHLIVPSENSPASSVSQAPASSHQKNGLNVPNRLSGTISPGLLPRDSSVSPELAQKNTCPVLPSYSNSGSASVIDPCMSSISPPVSLASSEKSSSPSLQVQQSSSVPRISSKKLPQSSCPSTPPMTHNFQVKAVHSCIPELPSRGTSLHLVLSTEPVPKTHVANKRLRKNSSHSEEEPGKKIMQCNGVFMNNLASDILHPVIDISGDCSRDSFGGTSDHGSVSWDICSVPKNEVPKDNGLNVSKNRGRKRNFPKGRRGKAVLGENSTLTTLPSVEDIVKEKIASIARIPKVKTTQELLAGLQAKTVPSATASEELLGINFQSSLETKTSLANCVLPSNRGSPLDALEISRYKTEHIAKFLRSQSELELVPRDSSKSLKQCLSNLPPGAGDAPESAGIFVGSRLSKEMIQSSSNLFDAFEPSNSSKDSRSVAVMEDDCVDKTVNEILSRLPPIEYDSISWDVSEHVLASSLHVSDSEMLDKLSTDHIEGVTGNFSHVRSLDNTDSFCEWNETVSRTSYQGELLDILPYVVID